LNGIGWIETWVQAFGPVQLPTMDYDYMLIKLTIPLSKQIETNVFLNSIVNIGWKKYFHSPYPIAISPLLKDDTHYYHEIILCFQFNMHDLETVLASSVVVTPENICDFYFHKYLTPYIKNIHLSGIDYVEQVLKKNDDETIIICSSMASLNNFVTLDPVNIVCNKTSEMLSVFGIEVAKKCLKNELCAILNTINPCHVDVIVDFMTFGGKIASISRYSSRNAPDVIKRMCFEEVVRNIVIACTNSECDLLKTTSSCVATTKLVSF
jgi:hypothetical protein